ncbi:MAG: sigma 54-interacting transcriptional regulator [Thermoanaerobaculia bacterium]
MSSESRRQGLDSATHQSTGLRQHSQQIAAPALTILAHPDPRRVGEVALLPGLLSGRTERLSRSEPDFASPSGLGDPLPLADVRMSRRGLSLSCRESGEVLLDARGSAMRVSVDGEPVSEFRELPATALDRGVLLLLARRVVLLLHRLGPISRAKSEHGLVGESAEIWRVRRDVDHVAPFDFPVLLRGKSGTGKELVARAIHDSGPRQDQPYVIVNMGAIPPSLAAAELFGSAKGAFTGADRSRRGYFQRADSGTLFLDEIGATPVEVQAHLLRTLETGQIQPVGGQEPSTVDVRVISATDTSLEAAIDKGAFRSPLLYRLSGYEIVMPPLSRRREDFGRLFFYFLRQELEALGEGWRLDPAEPGQRSWIPAELIDRLAAFPWPGNVRQLRNVVRQLAVSNQGTDELQAPPQIDRFLRADSRSESRSESRSDEPSRPRARSSYRHPDDIGETELVEALRRERWNLTRAASRLNVSRTSLYALLERSPHIRKASDLSRAEIEACSRRCGGDLDAMVERLEVSKRGLRLRMTDLGLAASSG